MPSYIWSLSLLAQVPRAGLESRLHTIGRFHCAFCNSRSEPGAEGAAPVLGPQMGLPRPRAAGLWPPLGMQVSAPRGRPDPQGLETAQVSQVIFKRNYSKSFPAQKKMLLGGSCDCWAPWAEVGKGREEASWTPPQSPSAWLLLR